MNFAKGQKLTEIFVFIFSYIFIYKNLKGTFKFSIPNIEPNAQEVQIWNEFSCQKVCRTLTNHIQSDQIRRNFATLPPH